MRHRYILVVGLAALFGFAFASFATYDFAQYLDREEHAIHCSFTPGLTDTDATGSSGCQVTMMSPYSSVFRTALWGGVPVALPAMGVFAFLLFWALEVGLSRRHKDRKATGFLALGFALPALVSVVMGTISFATLGAACKLCIGIYVSSAVGLVGAFLLWREAAARRFASAIAEDAAVDESEFDDSDEDLESSPAKPPALPPLGWMFALGVAFVAVPTLAYVLTVPDHHEQIVSCGALDWPEDSYKVMVSLGSAAKSVPAVEVLDPLCPSCRAFEARFGESGVAERFARQALLFPLDNTCNWMVDSAVHPGACAVSEAVLCAGDQAPAVLDWAFEHQDEIKEAAAKDGKAAARMASEAFPRLRNCIGSPAVRTRLNKSLRWAVKNRLQVLTPQFFVEGVKLCPQDVDLGLDYALTTMLDMRAKGTLPIPAPKPEPPRFQSSRPLADAAATKGAPPEAADADEPEPPLVAPPPEPEEAPPPAPDTVPTAGAPQNGEAQ